MKKEKNIIKMVNYYLKGNNLKEKEMEKEKEKEKNIMKMVN